MLQLLDFEFDWYALPPAQVLPMLVLLAEEPVSSSAAECALTENQKSLLQSMAAEIGSTCTYNVTIGPQGVEQW